MELLSTENFIELLTSLFLDYTLCHCRISCVIFHSKAKTKCPIYDKTAWQNGLLSSLSIISRLFQASKRDSANEINQSSVSDNVYYSGVDVVSMI